MTVSEAPSVRAMSLAPRTSISAPMSSATRPTPVVVRCRANEGWSAPPSRAGRGPASVSRPHRTERTLNATSRAASPIPTGRETTPAAARGQRARVAPSMSQNSRRSRPRGTANGVMTAVIPRISPRFAALLPMTFPTASPGLSPSTATRPGAISGADVP